MYDIGIGYSVEHGCWEQKGLPSALADQGPYEFAVSGDGEDYIDLFNNYLFVEAQIVKTDGSDLDPDTALVIRRSLVLLSRNVLVPHHARQLRFASRWSVNEKSFYVSHVGIHAGRWRN
jgi:hypothetical protein